jgi:hypothetical protein
MSTFFSEKSTQAWGYAVKAHGADAAYQAASELALLAGRTATACPVLQDDRQAAGLPFSSAATVPAATASRHDAARRASNGVTSPAISSRATNANSASSPSASTISLISASGSTPPS